MKRTVLTVLAALGVLGALAATTSATATQASLSGMVGIAAAGLVVLLEVINVAGTWTWLTDTRRHVRIEAGIGVGAASLVTGWCGLLTYGPIGAVAPAGLLFAVHLVFRLNQPAPVPSRVLARVVPSRPTVPAGLREASRVSWPKPSRPPAETIRVAGYQPVPQDEDTEPVPLSSVATGEDEDVITALLSRDAIPGIGAIAREYGIGKDKATRCKRAAERRRSEAA